MILKKGTLSNSHHKTEEKLADILSVPHTENCVIALNLDKDLKEEHVLIGELKNIQRYLLGYDAELLANEKRPFGTLVEELSETNDSLSFLYARNGLSLYPPRIASTFHESLQFIKETAASSNLAKKFVAIRIFQELFKTDSSKEKDVYLSDIIQNISWPFSYNESSAKKVILQWQQNRHTVENLRHLFMFESDRTLFNPLYTLFTADGKSMTSYQAADTSIISLLPWYMLSVYSTEEYFQICKQCGKVYHATQKRQGFCSDECLRIQRRINKASFDERAKVTAYEPEYKRIYMYWYNRLKKIDSYVSVSAEEKEQLFSEFKDFCFEAKKRKNSVKKRNTEFAEFRNWLIEQQNHADLLMDKYLKL